MNSIREQEDALFKEWHNSRKKENRGKSVNFVRDGMVDEASYTASSPKIAYVLKEYAPAGKDNDLRCDLFDGVGYWWWKVAYMTHNIRRLDLPARQGNPPIGIKNGLKKCTEAFVRLT